MSYFQIFWGALPCTHPQTPAGFFCFVTANPLDPDPVTPLVSKFGFLDSNQSLVSSIVATLAIVTSRPFDKASSFSSLSLLAFLGFQGIKPFYNRRLHF